MHSAANDIPDGWDTSAHQFWNNNQKQEAVSYLFQVINQSGSDKPVNLILQAAYYLILLDNYSGAVTLLEYQLAKNPNHLEVIQNLALCYGKLQRHQDAVNCAFRVIEQDPNSQFAYDVLTKSYYFLNQLDLASNAGTKSLAIKDEKSANINIDWRLPSSTPKDFVSQENKTNVISFSLWGSNPRYLRGSLHNILAAKELFPDWQLQFHVDSSVPDAFCEVLTLLGVDLKRHIKTNSIRKRLCWRFLVANDPHAGYFMVRDTDSVISLREKYAVEAWLASDKWFHVMRDWWTHTDLMLAGMWGGVAGVLPDINNLLQNYSSGYVETPNIDQWFLGNQIWPYVKQSCFVHDRFFSTPYAVKLSHQPTIADFHIGQDEFAVRRQNQATILQPFLSDFPILKAYLHF